jgi:hypothetical protein
MHVQCLKEVVYQTNVKIQIRMYIISYLTVIFASKRMMYKYIIYLVLLAFAVACGSQRQLNKSFNGRPVALAEQHFGRPVSIIKQQADSLYVFERKEELHSTEISQGRMSLDPIVTPQVHKTQRFYFTVRNGRIVESRFEEEYKR